MNAAENYRYKKGIKYNRIDFYDYNNVIVGNLSLDEVLTNFATQEVVESNKKWAESREATAKVREEIAVKFMLDYYCDVEVTDELLLKAVSELRKKFKNV